MTVSMRVLRRLHGDVHPGLRAAVGLTCSIAMLVGMWCLARTSAGAVRPTRPERSATARAAAASLLRRAYRAAPDQWPPPHIDPGIVWSEVAPLPAVEHPATNPFSRAKALLGRELFFEPGLSGSGKLACGSCHDPSLGWSDGRAVGQPVARPPGRNTPSIRNAAHRQTLCWDGRIDSLERQAEEALLHPLEMAASGEHVVAFIAANPSVRELFAAAYPGETVTVSRVVQAIACFERTVVGGRSRFDAFLRGDVAELTDDEILGLDLFRREARCMNCHHGPTFSDGRLHVLGLSFFGKSNEDLGRYAVSGDPADSGKFLTPTLRDVTNTAPYMHSGRFTLAGVLNMYNAGMGRARRREPRQADPLLPVVSPHVRVLGLNRQDLADLAAFLGTLAEPLDPPGRPQAADGQPPRIKAAR